MWSNIVHENHDNPDFWIPDNPDGSGWAEVEWGSVAHGSRYHYQHGAPLAEARAGRSPWYAVVARLETNRIEPHVNTYYVPGDSLADFIAEFSWNGGDEVIWHIETCDAPPPESQPRR